MLKKVTILPTEEYKKGLSTYSNLFRLKEGQSPNCIDVQFNIDGSVSKRLGTTTMNTTALQGTGGWGMFDGGVNVIGLDTAVKLLLHCDGKDEDIMFEDASADENVVSAKGAAQVDTGQKKFGTGSLYLPATDGNTVLMLHCNGSDASTTIVDEIGKTITPVGSAQLDTAQKKFGVSSLELDGVGSYVSLANSTDWDFGTGNFTMECQVRFGSTANTTVLWDRYASANDRMIWYMPGGATPSFSYTIGGGTLANYSWAWTPPLLNTWYHMAIIRNGTTLELFIDGSSPNKTETTSVATNDLVAIGTSATIGNDGSTPNYLTGWIDEYRVTKGLARWVADFTAPIIAYAHEGTGFSHLSLADNDNWNFDGDFTIDFHTRFDSTDNCIFAQQGDIIETSSDKSFVMLQTANNLSFRYSASGSGAYSVIHSSWTPVVDTWYHVAIVRNDTTLLAFVDGAQVGSDSLLDGALYNSTDNLLIGAGKNNQLIVDNVSGWMDEVRVSKGVARWTASFTVPAEEYSSDDIPARRLLCASGTGIYYSSDLGKTWTVNQTSRTQAMNHFSFIKNSFVNTNDDYQPPHYWAGTAGTYFAPIATDSAPTCKYSLSYQGFALMLNEKTNKRSFYYADESELFTEDSWSNFEFPTQKNDELTGGFVLRDKLYVSSKFKLFRVSYIGGNPDWSYKEVKNWGFVPETFRKVQIPGVGEVVIGLDWEKNIRLFNGFEDEIVSTEIEKNNSETPFYMDNINDNNLKFAWAEDDKRERLYRLMVVYGGSDRISKELIYNYRANAFYPSENRKFQFGVSAQDTAGGLHMMVCDYSGRIHHIDSGNTDAGIAINEHYTSHFIYPESPSQVHKAQKAYTYWDVDSTGMIYFEDRTDFSNVWNSRKCFEIVSTLSAVQTSQAIDLPTIAKTYQYKVHSSASTANPWQLNRFDYVQTTIGIGKP